MLCALESTGTGGTVSLLRPITSFDATRRVAGNWSGAMRIGGRGCGRSGAWGCREGGGDGTPGGVGLDDV